LSARYSKKSTLYLPYMYWFRQNIVLADRKVGLFESWFSYSLGISDINSGCQFDHCIQGGPAKMRPTYIFAGSI